jgi:hypothetical protein
MRSFLAKHLKVIGGAVAIGLGISAALGVAAVQENDGTIHACVITIAGVGGAQPQAGANLHVIDPASQSCEGGQMPITIAGRGLQGPPGAAGAPGPAGESTGECGSAAVGHLTLSGNPSLSTDVCSASLAKIGSTASARGKSQVGSTEFVVTRKIDKSSPKLFQATVSGTVFKSAKLLIFKTGKTLTLGNASISSYKTGLGNEQPTETLTLVAIAKKGA